MFSKYEGHPETEDRLDIKKNKHNKNFKKCIIITDPKLFFYIVATSIQAPISAREEFLYAFVIDIRRKSF